MKTAKPIHNQPIDYKLSLLKLHHCFWWMNTYSVKKPRTQCYLARVVDYKKWSKSCETKTFSTFCRKAILRGTSFHKDLFLPCAVGPTLSRDTHKSKILQWWARSCPWGADDLLWGLATPTTFRKNLALQQWNPFLKRNRITFPHNSWWLKQFHWGRDKMTKSWKMHRIRGSKFTQIVVKPYFSARHGS